MSLIKPPINRLWAHKRASDPDYMERLHLKPMPIEITPDLAKLIHDAAGGDPEKIAQYTKAQAILAPYKPAVVGSDLQMPLAATYGKFAERVFASGQHLGIAYLAALAMCAPLVRIKEESGLRDWLEYCNFYACGMLRSGGGKGATWSRVKCLFFDKYNQDHFSIDTFGSELGIMTSYPAKSMVPDPDHTGKGPAPKIERINETAYVCVYMDEMKAFLNKCQIQGSSLMLGINELHRSHNIANSKDGCRRESNVSLSFFGCIPLDSIEDYGKYFTEPIREGLQRRMPIAWCPDRIDTDITWTPSLSPLNPPRINNVFFSNENLDLIQNWWKPYYIQGDPDGMDGAPEIISRVACISAAMSGETEVSFDCLKAAMAFMDWQIVMKRTLVPSRDASPEAQVQDKIIKDLEEAQVEAGINTIPDEIEPSKLRNAWINWARLSHRRSWYRLNKGPSKS